MKIIMDGHNDTIMHLIDEESLLVNKDLSDKLDLHITLDKLESSGLNAPIFAAFTEGYYDNEVLVDKSLSKTLSIINGLYHNIEINKDRMALARNPEEILKITAMDKVAALLSIEGAYFINESNYVDILKQMDDLSVSLIGLTWNYSNNLAQGVAGVYSDAKTKSFKGLSKLGKETLKIMENLGILVDVSHISEESFYDIAKITNLPLIASHSGVYNLRSHRRNLKDEQLKLIAKSNGLVGVVLADSFLSESNSILKDYIDHIDYIVKLVGIDHVALGSDFDGAKLPEDLKDSSELNKIFELLKKSGYSQEDLEKIAYKNFFRVLNLAQKRKKISKKLNASVDMDIGNKIKFKIKDEVFKFRLIVNGREIESFKPQIGKEYSFSSKFNLEKFSLVSLEFSKYDAVDRYTYINYQG